MQRSEYTSLSDDEDFESSSWAEGRGNGGRDVDDYNRRGNASKNRSKDYAEQDTLDPAQGNGAYTERIVRFHSPRGVVVSSPYYVDYYDYYYDPFFYDPWRYSWYSPWYAGFGWSSWYGPSWSWGWGWGSWYDPWYYYGPSWAWGWGHHHHHWGWGHGWDWAYRPSNAVGASHNRGWVSYGNGRRPATGNRTDIANRYYNGRPGNRYTNSTGRPSRYDSKTRPSRNFDTRPSRNLNTRPSRDYNNSSRPSRSYNSESSRPSRNFNSGSSFSRPSRSGGFSPSRGGGSGARRGR